MPPVVKAAKLALPERPRPAPPRLPVKPLRLPPKPSPAAALRSRAGNRGAEQLIRRAQRPATRKGAAKPRPADPRARPLARPAMEMPQAKSPTTRRVLTQIAAAAARQLASLAQRLAQHSGEALARAAQTRAAIHSALGTQIAATRSRFAGARGTVTARTQAAIGQVHADGAAKHAALAQGQATETARADTHYTAQQARVDAMGASYATRAQQTADEVAGNLRGAVVGKAQEARTIGQNKAQAGGEPGVAEAKAKVAQEISADTADKVMAGIGDGEQQIKATGPQAADSFREQAGSISTQLGEGKAGVAAQLSGLYESARGALQQLVSGGERQLAGASAQLHGQLAASEGQTVAGLTETVELNAERTEALASESVAALHKQAGQAAAAAETRIDETMRQIAPVDVPEAQSATIAQQVGARLGPAFDGLIRSLSGAAGQIGDKTETVGSDTIAASQTATGTIASQLDQGLGDIAQGIGQQRSTLAAQLDGATAQSNAAGASLVSQVATQLGAKVDEIDAGFDKGLGDYRNHISTQVKDADGKANEPVSTLDPRISEAQAKAEARAKKGFFERQWDDFKEMVSDPGFWVGLVVGLLLALAVVALIVAGTLTGGLAIILVFALVGAIAAGLGSIVSQATGGKFGNGFDLGRVDPGKVLVAMALGAVGAAIITGVVLWMGPAFSATIGGLAIISGVTGLITIATNLITGEPWDKNLLANMSLAFLLGLLMKAVGGGKGRAPVPPEKPPVPPEQKPPVPSEQKPPVPPEQKPPEAPPVVPGKAQLLADIAATRENAAGARQKVNALNAGDRAALDARTAAAEQEIARLQAEADAAPTQRKVDALRERLDKVDAELENIAKNPLIELGLRQQTIDALRTLENVKADPVGEVNQVGSKNHYGAARREAGGEVVARRADGRPFDHIQDLQQGYNALNRVRGVLEQEQRNPPGTMTERGLDTLLKKYSEVQVLQSRLKGFLDSIGHGPPYPPFHEWPPGA